MTSEGQVMKAIFDLKQHLTTISNISIKHTLVLFGKLIFPIVYNRAQVVGFSESEGLERIHTWLWNQELIVKLHTKHLYIRRILKNSISVKKYRISITKLRVSSYKQKKLNKEDSAQNQSKLQEQR